VTRGYQAIVILGLVVLAACDSSDSAPSGGGGGTTGPTITITSSGVSPKTLTVSPGTQVTFFNNDSRSHEMASDPHPTHENCTAINQVGVVGAGQSRQTGNLNTVRSCGYHDHSLPENTSLQGTITVQ
jgi:plastocyanin